LEGAACVSWRRIAFHLDRGRTHAVSLQDPEMEAASESITALHSMDAGAGSEMDVEALLRELPENYRQVVMLVYLEQKAYEEVATALGVPLGTVKTLLFRARKELLKIKARQERILPVAVPKSQRSAAPREILMAAAGLSHGRAFANFIMF
jgi:DNA-directed RNA polymerase specialized sigma24 family protein